MKILQGRDTTEVDMRSLGDAPLPQQERERQAIRETIEQLMEQMEDTWKQVEPALSDAIAHGEYDLEYVLRSRAQEQLNSLRLEIKELRARLAACAGAAKDRIIR
jgi:hypothetical protein